MKKSCKIQGLLVCFFFLCFGYLLPAKGYSIYYTQQLQGSNLVDSANQWHENLSASPNEGFDPKALWIKVTMDSIYRFLVIENAHIDTLQIFFYSGDSLLLEQMSGDRVPFENRTVAFHYINFEIPDGCDRMYMRVQTEGSTATPILLLNKDEIEYFISEDRIIWTYFGVLIFTFVLNFIFGIYLKEKTYLFYCLYVLGMLVFFMIDYGYLFQLFYPDTPDFNRYAPCFYSVLVLSYVFAEQFLGITRKSLLVKILFRLMYASYAVVWIFAFYDYSIAIQLIILNFLTTPVIIIGAAIYTYFKSRRKPVLIFILAWSSYLFFLTLYSLASSGWFPYHLGIAYWLLFGSILEVLILQFAVLYKINELRNESIQDKLKVVSLLEEKEKMLLENNMNLENLVNQRTQELKESTREVVAQNNMLQLQQQELEEQHEKLETQKEIIEDVNTKLREKHKELEDQVFERTKELVNTNQELQEKNKRLEQFSYVAAHNLRGPVATLLGLTQLAKIQSKTNEKIDEDYFFANIERTATKLDAVISGLSMILDIEKNNEGLLTEVNLAEVLRDVKELLKDEFMTSRAKIITSLEFTFISGIAIYIHNILYNLISNSIKYKQENNDPVITIKTYREKDMNVLEYSDNSIGMDLVKVSDQLFKPFKRYTERKYGLGLGLYMIKVQVEALQGTVKLESSIGGGVRYKIFLPGEFKI